MRTVDELIQLVVVMLRESTDQIDTLDTDSMFIGIIILLWKLISKNSFY